MRKVNDKPGPGTVIMERSKRRCFDCDWNEYTQTCARYLVFLGKSCKGISTFELCFSNRSNKGYVLKSVKRRDY